MLVPTLVFHDCMLEPASGKLWLSAVNFGGVCYSIKTPKGKWELSADRRSHLQLCSE